jgi:hypothetical protein
MIKDIDYRIAGAVLLGAILLIVWLIRRDRKDKGDFEKEVLDVPPKD